MRATVTSARAPAPIAYRDPVLVPRLGAHPDDGGTAFAVFSRGDAVDVCLLEDDGGERRLPLAGGRDDVWTGYVDGVRPGQRYAFRVRGPWDPGHGHRFDPADLLLDPYARAVEHVRSPGSRPTGVVFHPGYDWQGDRRPQVPWADTVVYELHVKGFTARHPGVPEELRGTYAGLAHPAAIEHLVGLGVTTVELLPVHQFASEPAVVARGLANYWGYNTVGFFAPHDGYAASGSRGQQVTEFRDMVRALHAAGIEVLLDVVYNHTAEGGPDDPTLSWRGLDNAAYYRLAGGRQYVDVTGCGNTVDLRHPRTLAMVTDSLRYWVEEMHVDGFRFDLAPALARESDGFNPAGVFLSVLGQDPVLSAVKLVAEPWDVGAGGYRLGQFPPPWAEWNDRFRDTVREAWLRGPDGRHSGGVRDLAYRLSGSADVFGTRGRGPLASVNFVTAHDGFTLRDLVSYDHKHNAANGEDGTDGVDDNHSWNCGVEGPTDRPEVEELRRRLSRSLLATLLLSTGVPMLTAGDELGRTQLGNNNAYCLDDGTTWLDWDLAGWQGDLCEWVRALLAVRRSSPVLRHDEVFDGRPAHADGTKDLAWFGLDGEEMSPERWFDHDLEFLAMYLAGKPGPDGSSPRPVLVLLNTAADDISVRLPGKPWATTYDVLLDTADERPTSHGEMPAGSPTTVAARTVRVLAATR
jgi:isoamylase